jgi:predicted nucleic acid-binding protein
MKRVVLADTGPLYAALDQSDQYHRRAQEELGRLTHQRREVVIVYPILFESYSLVLYCFGKRTASSWLNETIHGASYPTGEDYREAADILRAFADQRITAR